MLKQIKQKIKPGSFLSCLAVASGTVIAQVIAVFCPHNNRMYTPADMGVLASLRRL